MEKLSILDITTLIRIDSVAKSIKSDKFIVIISAYRHAKEYLGFTIDNAQPNVYKNINGEFYFYDDFFDFEGDKSNKKEIQNHYDKYYHIYISLNHMKQYEDEVGYLKMRIDYRPMEEIKVIEVNNINEYLKTIIETIYRENTKSIKSKNIPVKIVIPSLENIKYDLVSVVKELDLPAEFHFQLTKQFPKDIDINRFTIFNKEFSNVKVPKEIGSIYYKF